MLDLKTFWSGLWKLSKVILYQQHMKLNFEPDMSNFTKPSYMSWVAAVIHIDLNTRNQQSSSDSFGSSVNSMVFVPSMCLRIYQPVFVNNLHGKQLMASLVCPLLISFQAVSLAISMSITHVNLVDIQN